MAPPDPAPTDAVVICTRNRPDDLANTLRSVAAQRGADERLVVVVDGSDPAAARETEQVVETWTDEYPFRYHAYAGEPAGTRQRNAGVDLLPDPVSIVHFIDDDVTLEDGYFRVLTGALTRSPSLLGVGGIIRLSDEPPTPPRTSWVHRLFLLNTDTPSQVLPSGQSTPAWPSGDRALQPADWLSTCASTYRRSVFRTHRFDPEAEGPSPRLEDLDFSYRVAQDGPLAVASAARCVHHLSSTNRRALADTVEERVIRRYWFVDKNADRGLSRAAYWWSMLGRLLILLATPNPDSWTVLPGFLRGLRRVWRREHDLLRRTDRTA
jgi:GT2 family glycosyltransferase